MRLLAEAVAYAWIGRIKLDNLARFRIFNREHSDVGECPFVRILNVHGDDVVPSIGLAQRAPQIRPCALRIPRG